MTAFTARSWPQALYPSFQLSAYWVVAGESVARKVNRVTWSALKHLTVNWQWLLIGLRCLKKQKIYDLEKNRFQKILKSNTVSVFFNY